MPHTMTRAAYAQMFGPTVGDKVRLADTDLVIEVEKDFTTYGEEVKFGGGKVIRDGMGQSQRTRREGAVDTVITNALILDHWGIVKADIAIKDGRIAAIGKAGNPDVQANVDIIIGPGTEVIAGEGNIVTAGGIDTHVHFICPQQMEEALFSGVTTMMGGGPVQPEGRGHRLEVEAELVHRGHQGPHRAARAATLRGETHGSHHRRDRQQPRPHALQPRPRTRCHPQGRNRRSRSLKAGVQSGLKHGKLMRAIEAIGARVAPALRREGSRKGLSE